MSRAVRPFRPPRRRGFTLLEVMIAVIIMGLGVLGLSALFAGAISQQQSASRINLTVGESNNLSQSLHRKLGRLAGDFSGCSSVDEENLDGRWVPVPADPNRGGVLSLAPICDEKLYFLAEAPAVVIFDNPKDGDGDPTVDIVGVGDSGNLPSEVRGLLENPISLRGHRLHPQSYSIIVEIGVEGLGEAPARTRFTFIERPTGGGSLPDPDQDFEDVVTLYRADAPPDPMNQTYDKNMDTHSYIEVNRRIDPDNSGTFPVLDDPVGITDFDFTIEDPGALGPVLDGSDQFIRRISISPHKVRTVDVVSLNDRLVYERDERFQGGRRPALGVALMYRRFGDTLQFAHLPYTLQPESVPDLDADDFPFIPPEAYNNWPESEEEDLLREVEVELSYDLDLERYVVSAALEDRWVVEAGQWLLMSSKDGVVGSSLTDPDPGASGAVQVLFQRPDPDDPDKIQGVLANPPRYPGLRADVPAGSMDTVNIHVWAFQPLVTAPNGAETNTDVEWRIRPASEPVIFTIGAS